VGVCRKNPGAIPVLGNGSGREMASLGQKFDRRNFTLLKEGAIESARTEKKENTLHEKERLVI